MTAVTTTHNTQLDISTHTHTHIQTHYTQTHFHRLPHSFTEIGKLLYDFIFLKVTMNNGLWNYFNNVRPPTPDKLVETPDKHKLVESEAEDSDDNSDDDRIFFRKKKSSHKRRFESPTTSDEDFIDNDDEYDDDSSYHLAFNQKQEEDDLKRRQEKAITSMNWEAKHKMPRHSPPVTQDSSVDIAKDVQYYQKILQPQKKKKKPTRKPEEWRAEKAKARAKSRNASRMVSPSSQKKLQPFVKKGKKMFGNRKKKKVPEKKKIDETTTIPEYQSYTTNPYGEDPYAQYDDDDNGGSSKTFINVT